MSLRSMTPDKIREILELNRQSGDTYAVKVAGKPSSMVGIAVTATGDPDRFVIGTAGNTPVDILFEGAVNDIEFLEKATALNQTGG